MTCNLFSDAYRHLRGLPGFPWESEAEFVQNWTDYYHAGNDLTSSLPVQAKLGKWSDRGCREVYLVLKRLTAPGTYPAFVDQCMKKLGKLVHMEGLEDSLGSLMLSESGSGSEQGLANSLGLVLLSSPPIPPEEMDYDTARVTAAEFEDFTDDPSIISITGEQTEISETAGFNDTTLLDYSTQSLPDPVPFEAASLDYVDSSILERLIRVKKGSRGSAVIEHPKKEYFRCQHIRALKKSIRQIRTGKIPGASIHKVNRGKASHMSTWNEMKMHYLRNKEYMDEMAETTSGPTTDGRSRREEGTVNPNAAKSYNDNFVSFFFSSPTILRYNDLFSDLVYDCTPEEICVKMKKTRCCKGSHSEHCVGVWKQVCNYAKVGMWRELERRP